MIKKEKKVSRYLSSCEEEEKKRKNKNVPDIHTHQKMLVYLRDDSHFFSL